MKTIFRIFVMAGILFFCLLLGGQMVLAQDSDPGVSGPYAVTSAEYDFGDTAFTPTGFPGPVEVIASVHYPTNLSAGPFPLIILLHGRHATCYQGTSVYLQWPCTPPRQSIPSYQGYDYIANILASHGNIVVSISANGINARDNFVGDLGMLARAELIQYHLGLWNVFNTTGGAPFGSLFIGKVNLNNVGTMGHSRGGEGVVRHFLLNQSLGSPYGIKAVFAIAPTDFSRFVINNVPLAVLLSYCDGDVSDLQGVHFYDDALYNVPGDLSRKHTILVMGGNHNFYNTVWTPSLFPAGGADDWLAYVGSGSSDPHCGSVPGNQRLTPQEQEGTGLAYVTGFFRTYVDGETNFMPLLIGDAPPPPSAMTTDIHVTSHAPDNPLIRKDVNRILSATNLTTNTLGGTVTQSGLTPYDVCGGNSPQPQQCLPSEPTSRQPHTTPSYLAPGMRGLSQLRSGWNTLTANYSNALPAGDRDLSAYSTLQFRAAVNFSDMRNPFGVPQDFSVIMTDGTGNSATALVSDYSNALYYPPGQIGPVPKVFLNGVRIPLSAFSNLDLTDIRSVKFGYDEEATGATLISDIAFTADGSVENRFIDVPPGYWAEQFIYKVYNAGITSGCSQSPLKYCPEDPVTRAQMAVFLGKGIHGSSFTPPAASGIFADVPVGYFAAKWIEQFYNDGITGGCSQSPLQYCPGGLVTRAQMAVFLLRSKHGQSYTPPPATGIFADVPVTSFAANWIEQLYNEGITGGCGTGPLRYCPDSSVTRAQMAVFIVRTFGL